MSTTPSSEIVMPIVSRRCGGRANHSQPSSTISTGMAELSSARCMAELPARPKKMSVFCGAKPSSAKGRKTRQCRLSASAMARRSPHTNGSSMTSTSSQRHQISAIGDMRSSSSRDTAGLEPQNRVVSTSAA